MNAGLKDCEVLRDPACIPEWESGEHHKVPLYCSTKRSRASKFCDVDILMLKDEEIKVIIEIEESDTSPIRICGKLLSSALSLYHITSSNDERFGMGNSVMFIQIVDTSRLAKGSSKKEQWKNLEGSIKELLQSMKTPIKRYRLIGGTTSEFDSGEGKKCEELRGLVMEAIGQKPTH